MNKVLIKASFKKKVWGLCVAGIIPIALFAQNAGTRINNIIPKPVSVQKLHNGSFLLRQPTFLYYDNRFFRQALILKDQIEEQCGITLNLDSTADRSKKGIYLQFDSLTTSRPEMYFLTINHKWIELRARDVAGMVHAIETFIQLLPLKPQKHIRVATVSVSDYPRFKYRGMHLDVSRHFFGVEFIEKYLDFMAFYKFNTFHWHLTDDQGWRIQIKSYPRLTSFGAWRDSTLVGHFREQPHRYDGKRYGGFYTQHQIKTIISYAADRGITVIPEIDIPGHCRAAIASYPALSTNPDSSFDVGTTWGMFNRQNNVLAPTTTTFQFLKKTFSEIADLFPSSYIHIGGDECSRMWWAGDNNTKEFIKLHGLKGDSALQTYFMDTVISDLKQKNKKVIGWDEILDDHLDTSAIIMNWRGIKAAYNAVYEKHYVIMSPGAFTYFNYSQTKDEDSLTAGGYLPLQKVYDFDPVPTGLSQADTRYILGGQGNMWTEYITNVAKLEYMLFPRMTALSEALWTPLGAKDFLDFRHRVEEAAIPRYRYWKSNYFKKYNEPEKKNTATITKN